MKWIVGGIAGSGGFLLGRRTYEIFAAYWPGAGQDEEAIAGPLNTRPKYVASRTLEAPLAWQNSRPLEGDVAKSAHRLALEPAGAFLRRHDDHFRPVRLLKPRRKRRGHRVVCEVLVFDVDRSFRERD